MDEQNNDPGPLLGIQKFLKRKKEKSNCRLKKRRKDTQQQKFLKITI